MTVADIKDYIDRAIDTAFAQSIAIDTAQILKKALLDTKGFLDELEPKAKWVNCKGRTICDNCGFVLKNNIEFPEFCESCGARMESE